MTDDWKSWNYRQKVIMQLEEIIRQSPAANQRNAHEIELQVFQRATKKEEYVQLMTRIMMHMQEMAQTNTQANNNPHIPEILNRHPGPSQISGPNPPMMNNAMNMQGSPRIGQPMPPNLPTQGGEMGSWPGNNRRIGEMQISGVGKKQPGLVMSQLGGQQAKMTQIQMTMAAQTGGAPPIGQVVGRGTAATMQPRVPSPGFPRQGTPTPMPTSASPAPTMNSQASPAFVSPSPSSGMVPSPAGCGNSGGMGRGVGHLGAPSPGGMLNTPGQVQQQSPAPSTMSNSQVEEAAYMEKLRRLKKYVVPLGRMIQRIGNDDGEKSRKMKQLYDMLQNPTRRMPMETLIKCEKVLERLEIRDNEAEAPVPPSMETCSAALEEVLTTVLKSPCAAHTLHRTLSPALSVLLGPTYSTHPASLAPATRPIQPPPETPDISDIVQGEVARLNARFRINLDCQMPPGSDELTLICQLDDPNLPCVPPITLTVPAAYPDKPPRCHLLAVDYESTEFLHSIRESMSERLQSMPPHCSLTMMLHSWEMSVRQACSPQPSVTSSIATAMTLASPV